MRLIGLNVSQKVGGDRPTGLQTVNSLARKMKDRLKLLLLANNFHVSRTTDSSRLKEFFRALRPVRTNHDLIRLGGDGDGGYLIPNDLESIDICFSPGVSDLANFELDLIRRGIKCFLADHSVDGPPIENELIDFEKKYLGPVENDLFITLENWVNRKAPNKTDFILQMDIEGAEYGVVFDTSLDILRKFRILVIEFHGLEKLCDKSGFEIINLTFTKLLKDFEVVHIHPNNCFPPIRCNGFLIPPLLEFTFLRKDRILGRQNRVDFPHALDRKSVPANEDYPLPECWYM
jgi:hypothetical protein